MKHLCGVIVRKNTKSGVSHIKSGVSNNIAGWIVTNYFAD